jgi:endonuclease/exonuclease/phosphatase family metal-dependent hydrolase
MTESYGKSVLAAFLVLTATAFADRGDTESGGEPIRFRMLSYNIHHGEGVDRKLDLQRIADVITSVNPDLVALQEVDRGTERTNKVDQPAELARLTGMNVVFGNNIRYQGGDYGNAVLSRFPVKRHKNHLLPLFDDGEQRGVLEVEVDMPNANGLLLFLATHLDHRAGDRERVASARAINELAATRASQPAVLAGDLNDLPESRTLREFETMWTRANEKMLPTVPVDQPTKQIDFILFRPADRWKTIEVRVLDEAVASDHRAIFAVLELSPVPFSGQGATSRRSAVGQHENGHRRAKRRAGGSRSRDFGTAAAGGGSASHPQRRASGLTEAARPTVDSTETALMAVRTPVAGAPGQKQPGLFDLADDLAERNDLAKQEPARWMEMLAAIEAWEKDVTADAPPQPDSPPRDVERQ